MLAHAAVRADVRPPDPEAPYDPAQAGPGRGAAALRAMAGGRHRGSAAGLGPRAQPGSRRARRGRARRPRGAGGSGGAGGGRVGPGGLVAGDRDGAQPGAPCRRSRAAPDRAARRARRRRRAAPHRAAARAARHAGPERARAPGDGSRARRARQHRPPASDPARHAARARLDGADRIAGPAGGRARRDHRRRHGAGGVARPRLRRVRPPGRGPGRRTPSCCGRSRISRTMC